MERERGRKKRRKRVRKRGRWREGGKKRERWREGGREEEREMEAEMPQMFSKREDGHTITAVAGCRGGG